MRARVMESQGDVVGHDVGGDDEEVLHHQRDRMTDPGTTGDDYFFGGNLQQYVFEVNPFL